MYYFICLYFVYSLWLLTNLLLFFACLLCSDMGRKTNVKICMGYFSVYLDGKRSWLWIENENYIII